MTGALILWTHALAALLFAALSLWAMRAHNAGLPRTAFAVAFGATALWALAIAGIGQDQAVSRLAEGARNIAWLVALYLFYRNASRRRSPIALVIVYTVVAAVIGAACLLYIAAAATPAAALAGPFAAAALLFRMMACLASLVLLHAVYEAMPTSGRAKLIALALLWIADCFLFTYVYLSGEWPGGLIALRGCVAVASAVLFAMALHRHNGWVVQVSRTFAYQSLSIVAIGIYFIVTIVATSAIAAVGGIHTRMLQTAFVFGCTAALLTLASSPWLRAWTKVKLAKHLFRHRYDYRAEWMRFTDTLGRAGGESALDERVVKAVADLVDSPAGVLLVPEGDGLGRGVAWNWDTSEFPATGGDHALATHLAETGRIIELDAVRGGEGGDGEAAEDAAAVPQWMLGLAQGWAVVPLTHFDQLVGAILLARPPLERALDWEDFDLLKVAGRQAASYLAEARSTEALMEAQRFDEFNRRFAFILHDIKNLVSQMSLVARNADRHGDNPEFRADMIVTVKESANRMNDLIARLSQHPARAEPGAAVHVGEVVQGVAAGFAARHAVTLAGERDLVARADAAALRQILDHLVRNAIDASDEDSPVVVTLGTASGRVVIDVIDQGCGMSPGFVRDSLFKPFISSKPGGFGIGAYEARQLAIAMGGTLDVVSREGEGTRFRLTLTAETRAGQSVEQAA